MLRAFLSIYLLAMCWSLRRIEENDNETPYQVLIYFAPAWMSVFDIDNNLYAPGIVIGLEKIDAQYEGKFQEILGHDLTYKIAECQEDMVSEAMDYLERQLITRRYKIDDSNMQSELSLILGPITTLVFLKPYCYGNRYNCMFGAGRITAATAGAISDDLRAQYYQNQVTNNIQLDNTVDGALYILEKFFEKYRWNFKQISIFVQSESDSWEQCESLVLTLQSDEMYSIDHSSARVIINPMEPRTDVPNLNYTAANDYLLNETPYKSRGGCASLLILLQKK